MSHENIGRCPKAEHGGSNNIASNDSSGNTEQRIFDKALNLFKIFFSFSIIPSVFLFRRIFLLFLI